MIAIITFVGRCERLERKLNSLTQTFNRFLSLNRKSKKHSGFSLPLFSLASCCFFLLPGFFEQNAKPCPWAERSFIPLTCCPGVEVGSSLMIESSLGSNLDQSGQNS